MEEKSRYSISDRRPNKEKKKKKGVVGTAVDFPTRWSVQFKFQNQFSNGLKISDAAECFHIPFLLPAYKEIPRPRLPPHLQIIHSRLLSLSLIKSPSFFNINFLKYNCSVSNRFHGLSFIMSFSIASSLEYSFRSTPNSDQILEVRFGHCSRLISRSSSPGIIPDQILQHIPSTLMGEALFPFSNLRHPRQHQGMEILVTEFLRSFNLHSSVCQIMCRKILSFARQFDGSFKIEAKIDYMEDLIWNMEVVPELLYPISIISEEAGAGAPESVIERLRKQKFEEEEEEEMEECCVCCEDLKGKGMEVSRIPCGHVYHKSCILTWLQINNSCPLCRSPLQP